MTRKKRGWETSRGGEIGKSATATIYAHTHVHAPENLQTHTILVVRIFGAQFWTLCAYVIKRTSYAPYKGTRGHFIQIQIQAQPAWIHFHSDGLENVIPWQKQGREGRGIKAFLHKLSWILLRKRHDIILIIVLARYQGHVPWRWMWLLCGSTWKDWFSDGQKRYLIS